MLTRIARMHAVALAVGVLMHVPCIGVSQSQPSEIITLEQALRYAKERNGVIKSAFLQVLISASRVKQAQAGFLPSVTPTFKVDATTTSTRTGNVSGSRTKSSTEDAFDIAAEWTILDAGERNWSLAGRKKSLESTRYSALQTLREKLFEVHQSYFEVLRTQSLLTVQEQQLARAQEILKQTQERISVKLEAAKNEKQAIADVANAEVSVIGASARRYTAVATFKAIVVWEESELPPLEAIALQTLPALDFDLKEAVQRSFAHRADLLASRNSLEATRTDIKIAEISAGIQWTLGATARRNFSPNVLDRTGLSFFATIPLFDGARSKEEVKARRATYDAQAERLKQSERDVASNVESRFRTYQQNVLRLVAAQRALEAAQTNYDAVSEARRLGAANLVDVITAQTSLVIAQSNYVEAQYDGLIAQVSLKLAMGEPIPGETEPGK